MARGSSGTHLREGRRHRRPSEGLEMHFRLSEMQAAASEQDDLVTHTTAAEAKHPDKSSHLHRVNNQSNAAIPLLFI